ncbi:adhesin [Halobacillus massiliensis]|uniref:adhesin n=1 Tax=Halobacillus massiliensis TaxID=1926286 RepID=UPI0009E65E50|nr:adhesin [Halobacillus massiliensis]
MKITEEAKGTLINLLGEQGAESVRLFSAGGGCCGPQIGLSLESAQDTDKIKEVNGIQLAIDPQVEDLVKEVTLDKQGEQFVLLGLSNCC